MSVSDDNSNTGYYEPLTDEGIIALYEDYYEVTGDQTAAAVLVLVQRLDSANHNAIILSELSS